MRLRVCLAKSGSKKKEKEKKKQDGYTRSSWQRTDRVVGGDERRGMKELVLTSPAAEGLLSRLVVLQVGRPADTERPVGWRA